MKSSALKKLSVFLLSLILISAVVILQSVPTISAATTKKYTVKSTTLQSGKQFTLANMPYNGTHSIIKTYKGNELTVRTVQNFDYTPDGKYIFTIGECSTGSQKHGLLTRCAIPKKTGQSAEAESVDTMVIEGFGHSDTLAITQDDLSAQVYNIWVSCNPGTSGYGRQIARLTYKVDKSGVGKITKTVYIKGLEKTKVTSGKAGYYQNKATPERVYCAIDADSNQIVFRVQVSGLGCYYLSYNLSNVNSAMNSVKNKGSFDISAKPKWQNARIVCNLTPLCNYQSFTVKGKSIYIIGGHFGLGAQIYVFGYTTQKNGIIKEQTIANTSELSAIIDIDSVIKIDDAEYDENYLEIQGLKVTKQNKKTYFHINYHCAGPNMRNSATIYKFTNK